MDQRRLPLGHSMAFPATVVLVGILISVGVFFRMNDDARVAAARRLNETGVELVRYADAVTHDAVEQAQAIKGLFEASTEVTIDEFALFTETIEDTHGSGVAFAPRVASMDFEAYLTEVRAELPSYRIHNSDLQTVAAQSGEVYWPLLYESSRSYEGFGPGFDLASDPVIRQAIEYSLRTGRTAASPFVSLPGDNEAGDFVIVTVIGRGETPEGLAVVIHRLDELLGGRVRQLLGSEAKITLAQTPDLIKIQEPGKTGLRWVGETTVEGQPVSLVVETYQPTSGSPFAPWLLIFGVAISILIGWVIYGWRRRHAMNRQLTTLEQTLTEKDRFLASISHAVRTPITGIVGALEILSDDQIPLEPEMRAVLLRDARISALDLERLTENYLTAARISSGAFTLNSHVIDLDVLTSRLLASLEVPQGVTVTAQPLGRCKGDLIRIHQIIRNLIYNATQHALTTVAIRSDDSPSFAIIEVANDGQPIPESVVENLFTPFEKGTVPGQPESIGLGLSVSRALARTMGGDLNYRYEGGEVTFKLSLMSIPPTTDTRSAADASVAVHG